MNDQERLDDLIIDGLQIYQRSDMFRFSFDAIALIHFCRFNSRHAYVDFGTGTGVMPLIGTSLGARHITGIDINETQMCIRDRTITIYHFRFYPLVLCIEIWSTCYYGRCNLSHDNS